MGDLDGDIMPQVQAVALSLNQLVTFVSSLRGHSIRATNFISQAQAGE